MKFINLPISSGFSYMRKIGLIFYRQCVMSHNSSVWFAVISEKLKELFLKILLLQVTFILWKAKAFLVGTRMSNGHCYIIAAECLFIITSDYYPEVAYLLCVFVWVCVCVYRPLKKPKRQGGRREPWSDRGNSLAVQTI